MNIWSNPVAGAALGTLGRERRGELLRRAAEGALPELEFEAIVFRAGPNRNHLRIAAAELSGFAASFVGVPFLRDHAVESVDARAGIVVSSVLDGPAIRQTIRLTTQRDIRAFLEGQMDRFSVSWYYDEVQCSVCGKEWGVCSHKPGRKYGEGGVGGHGHGAVRKRCELLFRGVVGKEVSAVNAPAVEGTEVIRVGNQAWAVSSRTAGSGVEGGANSREWVDSSRAHAGGERGSWAMEEDFLAALPQGATKMEEALHETSNDSESEWTQALRAEAVEGMLARAGLSQGGRAVVRSALGGASGGVEAQSPAQVRGLIAAQQQAEAALGGVRAPVYGVGQSAAQSGARAIVHDTFPVIAAMRTAADEVQGALDWLMGDVRTPMPPPHMRNLRDLYLAITGDVNFWGVFNPDYARLQSANSGTLAGMAVNALNKAVMLHYDNLLTYRWYEQIVHVLPHDGSTQQLQLIHMDGLATLPSVAEGAAYTEATAGDSKETAIFQKYGSYVGITLEMIRRSELARIQAIPRLLVQAAIRRRSAAIASVFTANPTLADDSTALFHANHGNQDTAAFGSGAWEAARTRIFEQVLPGSGKPLALWPTYCLVPIELYDDALAAFGYGSGDVGKPNAAGTAQEPNIYAMTRPGDPRPVPVVVPEWSDATDWAYIVDPRLHPVLVMAYANAPAGGVHALPELFEVRSETSGLLFSHDTLPVKVRDWWAYGVTTHVGVGRNVVAG